MQTALGDEGRSMLPQDRQASWRLVRAETSTHFHIVIKRSDGQHTEDHQALHPRHHKIIETGRSTRVLSHSKPDFDTQASRGNATITTDEAHEKTISSSTFIDFTSYSISNDFSSAKEAQISQHSYSVSCRLPVSKFRSSSILQRSLGDHLSLKHDVLLLYNLT